MKKRLSECNGKAKGLDAGLDPAIDLAESLPEAWIVVPFVRSIDDKRVPIIKVQQAKYKNAGQFPIIDQGQKLIAGYWDDEGDVYRGRLPVIVFGDHTRAFKFVDFPFVAGADGTHVLAPCADRFDPYFLYLALSSLDIPSRGYNRHFRFLKERSVVAPPLPEQRAIAAVLRTVQRAKEACEKVIAATRAQKQSLLHHLFTYGPVPFDQADRVALKETEVGMVPEAWTIGKICDYATLAQYGLSVRGGSIGRYPMLRMNNLQDGRIVTEDIRGLQYLNLDPKTLARFRLQSGDLLFNRTNSYELVGKISLFDLDGDFVFASYLVRLSLDHERIEPRYANYYLNVPATQGRLKLLAIRAVSQSNINATKLKGFAIPVPPLSEQSTIASHLSAVDAKLAAEEKRRTALDNLFNPSYTT
jgi:type I restriction enzyme, S subunit